MNNLKESYLFGIVLIAMVSVSIFLILLASGSENSYREEHFPERPKELEDCKIYYLQNKDGNQITVVRCRNSETSTAYKAGKADRTAVVTDAAAHCYVR